MKVLFIFPDNALSENFSGGASRMYCAYHALIQLGHEVFVWRPLSSAENVYAYERERFSETAQVKGDAKRWQDVEYEKKMIGWSGLPVFFKRMYEKFYPLINPFDYYFPGSAGLRESFRVFHEEIKPDLVWVETPFLGAVVYGNLKTPWIYENLDFLYKLKPIRLLIQGQHPSFYALLENWLLKRAEYKIASASNFVVTGSVSEAEDMQKYGQPNTVVIPTTYHSVSLTVQAETKKQQSVLRILHFGALTTTANYAGLKTYLEKVHPRLADLLASHNIPMELVLIGDPANAKQDLLALIAKNHAQLLGFQPDLQGVLRPFDISIIPYAENTGTRTKVPLLMNYAQVIVATENSVAGTPEVMNCSGCFFTKDVDDFIVPILQLALDVSLREKMGLAAKTFFEEHFTLESKLDRYKLALDSALPKNRK